MLPDFPIFKKNIEIQVFICLEKILKALISGRAHGKIINTSAAEQVSKVTV